MKINLFSRPQAEMINTSQFQHTQGASQTVSHQAFAQCPTPDIKSFFLQTRRSKHACARTNVRKNRRTYGIRIWVKLRNHHNTTPARIKFRRFGKKCLLILSFRQNAWNYHLILKSVFSKVNCLIGSHFHCNCCGNKAVSQGWEGKSCVPH